MATTGYQGYYPTEANGNTGASPYHLRHGDRDLEDQEGDIDPIVAEIKRNLSMTSITSASEASPKHGPELGPGDSAESCVSSKASCSPSRHEAKRKSLNLPPEAKHCEDPQRGFKPKTRTPEERPKWLHEQVCLLVSVPRRRMAVEMGRHPSCCAPGPVSGPARPQLQAEQLSTGQTG
ncbi:Amyloid-beta A4 precursor protein-binding A member 2 [Saguinus oedipus]|uniref:Amyloid-beta A4 protein-binding A member 2 n=1 Tax=Saguinus oedipus TaxID=9490 RepID=A0ABQ9UZL4_SAGOE|nr:Amyloid-beta A4 precursor protein-binding A member 2 [Saguinus oedipus]